MAIRDVVILDGTGTPGATGDLAVTGERISAVGRVGAARVDLDGRGLVAAPGFVDAHSHDDGALLRHPGMAFKLAQGCTTVVVGNCGFSAAPAQTGRPDPVGLLGITATWEDLDGYSRAVAAARPAVNAVALVGHNTVRSLVMGNERRAPTPAELDRMGRLVAAAMAQGACGLSSGLVYEPGRYCATDELIALARQAAAAGGIYATHLRNEGDHLEQAVEEALAIGREAGLGVQISHHKAAGARNWGKVARSLALVDRANNEGADVSLDVYPYTAGSGPMAQYFRLERIDPELAAVIRFATCPPFRPYEGRMAADLAAEQGVTPAELIGNVLRAPGGDGTICIQFVMAEADIETNLAHPRMMIGSDGIPDLGGRPHPRLYGTFPRVLGHYVRDRQVLGLAEAVRRMTSLPADRFGLTDRGRVAEGGFADLVVFDPAAVADTATYDDPQREPAGVELVIVNGRVSFTTGRLAPTGPAGGGGTGGGGAPGGRHTGAGAGRLLRYRSP